jgi:hypothetical protein
MANTIRLKLASNKIILAWMTMLLSVTLGALLTVILLPCELLSVKRSLPFVAMTFEMLWML